MLGDRLEKEWKKELEGAKKKEGDSPKKDAKEKSPSLFKAMLRCFGPRYAMLGIFTFFEECILRIYQPLFMGEEDLYHQGGRSWLAFGERKIIPQSFRRARIYKFSRQNFFTKL